MKTKKFILLLLVSLLTLSLASCEKDGDGQESLIVGEWRLYKDYDEGEYYYFEDNRSGLKFHKNGTGTYYEGEPQKWYEYDFIYEVEDSRLILRFTRDDEIWVYTILTLTETELIIEEDDYRAYHIRVK